MTTRTVSTATTGNGAAVAVLAGGLVAVGLLLGLLVGFENYVYVWAGPLALAFVVIILGVPATHVRGVAAVVALAAVFVGGANTAPVVIQASSQMVGLVVMVVAMIRATQLSTSPRPSAAKLALLLVTAWVGLIAFSALLNDDIGGTLPIGIAVPVVACAMFSQFSEQDFVVFARLLVLFAFGQVALSVVEFTLSTPPVWGFSDSAPNGYPNPLLGEGILRSSGTAGHPIVLSVIYLVTFTLLWRNSVQWPLSGRVLALLLIAVGLVISGTRSALLAILVAVVVSAVLAARTFGARLRNAIVAVTAAGASLLIPSIRASLDAALAELLNSGSYSHRAGAYESIGELITRRSSFESSFGSGRNSIPDLFDRGFLQQDGFRAVDNQFVNTLGTGGLAAVVVLFTIITLGLIAGSATSRILILSVVVMFLSFDALTWYAPNMLFFALIGLAGSRVGKRSADSAATSSAALPSRAAAAPLRRNERVLTRTR
ncbi:O-antigen ligase family protein [Rathayibacter sp. Leaf248]|uniref:O-antigen ligase family protein n=1 Tax=Rathayibacter sp. Leaf248 TaxID=2876555 RepID=UPI001E40799B|nr:O-antigen ligase family protein [Rathayibacter sp. Leaf248]